MLLFPGYGDQVEVVAGLGWECGTVLRWVRGRGNWVGRVMIVSDAHAEHPSNACAPATIATTAQFTAIRRLEQALAIISGQ